MSRARLWLRVSGLAIGAVVLIWAPFEDTDVRGVLLISAAVCAWLSARLLLNLSPAESWWSLLGRHACIGALAGLAVAPLGFLLMALKSGLHGHALPDFTLAQAGALFELAPYLGLAGLLLGLGTGLWRGLNRGAEPGITN